MARSDHIPRSEAAWIMRLQSRNKMTANELYEKLLQMYGKPRWWSDDPYVVMFQAILVQNTSWILVEKTTASMGATLDPRKIAVMSETVLEELIRPCGFAKGKATTIKRFGYHFETDAEIRSFFEDGLPMDYEIYGWLHWLILDHSIQRCKKNPECDGCEFQKCKERR